MTIELVAFRLGAAFLTGMLVGSIVVQAVGLP